MFALDALVEVVDGLRPLVAKLDAGELDDGSAAALVEGFVEVERLAVAGQLIATRAISSERWRAAGFRSAGAWMAAKAATPPGAAIEAMEMMSLLDGLPATEAAFRAGELSLAQMQEVVEVVSEWPAVEEQLLDAAAVMSLAGLREECGRVKAALVVDEEERHRRLRERRYLRSWTDRDGAVRLSGRLTPEDGARLLAVVDARRDERVAEARAAGWVERGEAHRADALVDLAVTAPGGDGRGSGGPEAMVHVVVDHDALVRGHTVAGERCEVPGVGPIPIPVDVARRLGNDAILKVLVTKGVDVTAVAHAGRTIPAHLRTALEHRDPKCIVPACEQRRDLQIDHRQPWAEGGPTTLENTARLCRWHHYQKSHLGYRYRGGPGTWEWIPPDTATEPPLHDTAA